MLLSENYIQYVKDMAPTSLIDYELISIDDLALLPRKTSLSETSSNGIASHDSGHDSYLDDGIAFRIIFVNHYQNISYQASLILVTRPLCICVKISEFKKQFWSRHQCEERGRKLITYLRNIYITTFDL